MPNYLSHLNHTQLIVSTRLRKDHGLGCKYIFSLGKNLSRRKVFICFTGFYWHHKHRKPSQDLTERCGVFAILVDNLHEAMVQTTATLNKTLILRQHLAMLQAS